MSCEGEGSCGDSPCPHESKMKSVVNQLISTQGWTVETMYDLAEQFLEKEGHYGDFRKFLEEVAKEENEAAEDVYEEGQTCPLCDSPENTPLGTLSAKKFVRCRACGNDYYLTAVTITTSRRTRR